MNEWGKKARVSLDSTIIFVGDFVDRGKNSLETITLLMALKVCFPERIVLLRGNHEDPEMNRQYSFYDEIQRRIPPEQVKPTIDLFTKSFSYMPLAALVAQRVFVVHGGIGDESYMPNGLSDVRAIQRPVVDVFSDPLVAQLLWSDPNTDVNPTTESCTSPRDKHAGNIKRFGSRRLAAFCEQNHLDFVVRAHELKPNGFEIYHNRLITIFSAANYCGKGNKGAALRITTDLDFSIIFDLPL